MQQQSSDPDLALGEELLAKGKLPASRLSRRFLSLIAPALNTGAVRRIPSGAGHAYEVLTPTSLRSLLDQEFSRANRGYTAHTAGARNLLRSRDTKAGGRIDQVQGLFVRTAVSRNYSWAGRSGDLYDLGLSGGGVSGFRLSSDSLTGCHIAAPLTFVENPEVFWNWELFEPAHERTLIFKGGTAAKVVLQWLAQKSMQAQPIEMAVDWDPVGLSEYQRFRDQLGAQRVSLHHPHNLSDLFQDLRKPKLLDAEKSLALLSRQRLDQDPAVQAIISLMDRHHAGLEHEALLLTHQIE